MIYQYLFYLLHSDTISFLLISIFKICEARKARLKDFWLALKTPIRSLFASQKRRGALWAKKNGNFNDVTLCAACKLITWDVREFMYNRVMASPVVMESDVHLEVTEKEVWKYYNGKALNALYCITN